MLGFDHGVGVEVLRRFAGVVEVFVCEFFEVGWRDELLFGLHGGVSSGFG